MFEHAVVFLIALGGYFVVIVGSVFWTSRFKSQSEVEFLTAGRSIGPMVGGAALTATQVSAGTLVGTVGRHYGTGVSWVWAWPGIWFGWLLSAVLIGPKLRASGAVTVPDYLYARFESKSLRFLAAIAILGVYVMILTAQYQACVVIFQMSFGLRPLYSIVLLCVGTLSYAIAGGIRAGSYVDLLQIAIILGGLLLSVPILLRDVHGVHTLGLFLSDLDPRLTGHWYSWKQLFALQLVFALGISASPNEMTRYASMRDKSTVRYAIGVCFILQALIGTAAMLVGLSIRAIFPYLASADQASSVLATRILPPFAGAIFWLAVLSAIMSNINGILIVTSNSISHDIYGSMLRPDATDKSKLFLNRLSMVLISLPPAILALHRLGDVQSAVLISARLAGCIFFVPIVFGLNFRFGSALGAMTAMLGGALASILWQVGMVSRFPSVDGGEVGLLISATLYLLIGLRTRAASEGTLAQFFGASQ